MASQLERRAGLSGAVSPTRPVRAVKVLEGLSVASNQHRHGPDSDAVEGWHRIACCFVSLRGTWVSAVGLVSSCHTWRRHQDCAPATLLLVLHPRTGPAEACDQTLGQDTHCWFLFCFGTKNHSCLRGELAGTFWFLQAVEKLLAHSQPRSRCAAGLALHKGCWKGPPGPR